MRKYNSENERIKRKYFVFLKEAKQYSEASVDAAAKAISRFEEYGKLKSFKAFHFEQAIAFKNHLAKQKKPKTNKLFSKSTLHSTLSALKKFIEWLSQQQGYKSRIQYSDAEYFNLSEKDTRIARAKRTKKFPTVEQVKHVIASMPHETDIEKRDRALVAFGLLTGARDSAIASFKLKHIDLVTNCVHQDAREVKTKFSKTFDTYFFPVGDEITEIFIDWVDYLRTEKLYGNDDPLFPKTEVIQNSERQFHAAGISKEHWSTASPIRKIYHKAFTSAGFIYFNPHSFRDTLAHFGEKICKTPEEFKAWSQNLGHENVLTTFTSYGEVSCHRQGEILNTLQQEPVNNPPQIDYDLLADAVERKRSGNDRSY